MLDTPNGYQTILLEIDKAIGNWAGETFCTDRTCAYNQGRLIFDVVSLFYGVGEAKALLKTGTAGAKIAKMIEAVDKTGLSMVKALRASTVKAQKIAAGFQLAVQLNTGIFFDIAKLETASKAFRFNVAPIVASALPNAKVIAKFDNIAYFANENGVTVVKHGSVEIVDNGATALPRVANQAGDDLLNAFKAGYSKESVLAIPKGSRPNPSVYLNQSYIDNHLANFNGGVTKITSYNPTGTVGPPGGTFVLPKVKADALIQQAGGDINKLEDLLGLNRGDLGTSPHRIDINSPSGLRMPSGNEPGANEFWIPGGQTSGGILEATVDQIQTGTYTKQIIFQ